MCKQAVAHISTGTATWALTGCRRGDCGLLRRLPRHSMQNLVSHERSYCHVHGLAIILYECEDDTKYFAGTAILN
jgi:hypothetical protein